ncbi:sugar-transfer associated ATP-grasp domain-containing protein [Halegenticoccus tardaugens]|uniref:sugar-transfer associated ATP-grasp domain-containing protein n=1 Tax=Halegenticoccus tardaugens TaxID=2071624 RepID=UPI00100A85EE|nr:sugar-transfer associated ATP-grasp domain-containing protein [Halegenticoccus tardaugens]
MATEAGTATGRSPSAWRSRTTELYAKHYPLVGLLLIVLFSGVLLRGQLDMSQRPLAQYRLFFELMLAGFVITLLRSKVGLVTYGMFGPIIISYILLASGPLWGTVLFVNLFLIALTTFLILEPFRLGTAHRIGALVMTVGVAITVFHVLADQRVLPAALDSLQVFFPAIITGWYADRFARDLSERGWRAPAIRFVWTLVAILVAYAILSRDALVSWFVHTPEAWAAIIGLNVWLGTTGAIRVKEYLRFSNVFRGSPWSAALSAAETSLHNAKARAVNALGGSASYRNGSDVLAMNRRNAYIKRYNPTHLFPELDKASMKRAFHGTGVSTPDTYLLVERLGQIGRAEALFDARDEFVIKPDSGYGGEGIVVVTGRTDDGERFETSKGERTPEQLLAHVRSVVEGHYSPMGLDGVAIVEELVHPDDFLRSRAGQGVPDIRVMVFKGFPIMAMTRLPTEESDGAANLHMGAIGVGLTVAEGRALGGYRSTNQWHDEHPDTGADLRDFTVPNWDEVLATAVHAAEVSRLGYAGVDVVVDEEKGPVVLEVNARPGLGIQNSTFDGLLRRLDFVESLPDDYDLKPPSEKIRLARRWDEADWETDATGTDAMEPKTRGSEPDE